MRKNLEFVIISPKTDTKYRKRVNGMTLGQKLHFYRTAEGYSQKAVADALDIERSTYSYYESGKTQPSLRNTLILARLYGVTMEMLVSEDYIPDGAEEFLNRKKPLHFTCHEPLRVIPEESSYYKKNNKKRDK